MRYEYSFAGLRIACQVPFPLTIREESREFLRLCEEGEADVQFSLQAADALAPPVGYWRGNRCYAQQDTWFCLRTGEPPFVHVHTDGNYLRAQYLRGREAELCYSNNLCDLLSIESLLLQRDAFLLHASFVELGGRALLFSAPSGTGKSTQAALWQTHRAARIVNGDRAALCFREGKWLACGIPYAGSSGICRNAELPCHAIVVLRQARENRVQRLSAKEAVLALYPEISVHEWEKAMVELAMTHLLRLLEQVPVYRLDCLANADAVRVLAEEVSL